LFVNTSVPESKGGATNFKEGRGGSMHWKPGGPGRWGFVNTVQTLKFENGWGA